MNLDFANDYFLILLVLLVPLGWMHFRWLRKKTRAVRFSDLRTLVQVNGRWAQVKAHVPFALRLAALALLVVALARPRSGSSWEDVTSEGIDIILTVDVSTSMLAEDLARSTNRLEAAKEVVTDFISRRRNDRIGLVAFAA
ncbi:MAG TPA: BatA domain-containing protein, partial [Candidatus Glassbacteria bacterium]|nr:BatA domain-containing protein [Candidatus Glassbacteria bacterium]